MHPHPGPPPLPREREDRSPLPLAGEGWVGVVPTLRHGHRAIDTGMSRCVHILESDRKYVFVTEGLSVILVEARMT